MVEKKDNLPDFLANFASRMQADTRAFREMIVEIKRIPEEQLRPFFEAQKHLEETIKPWIEARKQMAEAIEPLRQMKEKLAKDFSSIASQIYEFQGNLNSLIGPAFTEIAEG